jgi:Di-haem oxidoreductase, putative peroxidase
VKRTAGLKKLRTRGRLLLLAGLSSSLFVFASEPVAKPPSRIGRENAIPKHLKDDEEFQLPLGDLLAFGQKLFMANWTEQDGGGRPLTKGTGKALSDPGSPLTGRRSFNRISGPDANSCYGCHNQPHGVVGGSGDFVTNVFVLGQRFDFVTLDPADKRATRGAVDEQLHPVNLQTLGNLRKTTGMFGAGYIEMLAREMTEDLQRIRGEIKLGDRKQLVSKGIAFGWLARRTDGSWDMSEVAGLPRESLVSATPINPPSLIIRPWHQAGNVVSIREFTNNALNQHHGIQTTERFGIDTDPDGDGVMNEMTRADVTAISVFQAAMAPPGRLIPNDPEFEKAVVDGEKAFKTIGCAECHTPSLPLTRQNWVYREPNPFNPATNMRRGDTKDIAFDLSLGELPQPRLHVAASGEVIDVPAYTDMKLHDITDPNDPGAAEPLDMNQTVWSPKFGAGNRRFLTRRLWGVANTPPYFHNGIFTTLRQAVLAHSGEALESRKAFQAAPGYQQDALIEFLKSLQVLPPGTQNLVVDENYHAKTWPR